MYLPMVGRAKRRGNVIVSIRLFQGVMEWDRVLWSRSRRDVGSIRVLFVAAS